MISMVPWGLDDTAEIIVDNLKDVGLFTTVRMVEWGHGQQLVVKENKIDVFINGLHVVWQRRGASVLVSAWDPLSCHILGSALE